MKYVKSVTLTIDITPELLHYLNKEYLDYEDIVINENPAELTEDELGIVHSMLEELDSDIYSDTEFATREEIVKIEN